MAKSSEEKLLGIKEELYSAIDYETHRTNIDTAKKTACKQSKK
jgi:hypothetical protein